MKDHELPLAKDPTFISDLLADMIVMTPRPLGASLRSQAKGDYMDNLKRWTPTYIENVEKTLSANTHHWHAVISAARDTYMVENAASLSTEAMTAFCLVGGSEVLGNVATDILRRYHELKGADSTTSLFKIIRATDGYTLKDVIRHGSRSGVKHAAIAAAFMVAQGMVKRSNHKRAVFDTWKRSLHDEWTGALPYLETARSTIDCKNLFR